MGSSREDVNFGDLPEDSQNEIFLNFPSFTTAELLQARLVNKGFSRAAGRALFQKQGYASLFAQSALLAQASIDNVSFEIGKQELLYAVANNPPARFKDQVVLFSLASKLLNKKLCFSEEEDEKFLRLLTGAVYHLKWEPRYQFMRQVGLRIATSSSQRFLHHCLGYIIGRLNDHNSLEACYGVEALSLAIPFLGQDQLLVYLERLRMLSNRTWSPKEFASLSRVLTDIGQRLGADRVNSYAVMLLSDFSQRGGFCEPTNNLIILRCFADFLESENVSCLVASLMKDWNKPQFFLTNPEEVLHTLTALVNANKLPQADLLECVKQIIQIFSGNWATHNKNEIEYAAGQLAKALVKKIDRAVLVSALDDYLDDRHPKWTVFVAVFASESLFHRSALKSIINELFKDKDKIHAAFALLGAVLGRIEVNELNPIVDVLLMYFNDAVPGNVQAADKWFLLCEQRLDPVNREKCHTALLASLAAQSARAEQRYDEQRALISRLWRVARLLPSSEAKKYLSIALEYYKDWRRESDSMNPICLIREILAQIKREDVLSALGEISKALPGYAANVNHPDTIEFLLSLVMRGFCSFDKPAGIPWYSSLYFESIAFMKKMTQWHGEIKDALTPKQPTKTLRF